MNESLREQYPNDDRTYAVASAMNRGFDWVEIDINQNTDTRFDSAMRNIIMDTMAQEAEFAWEAGEAIKYPEASISLVHAIRPELAEERRQNERKAHTDALTGLANVHAFEAALPMADADEQVHVLFFDAVNFKKLNDKLGQEEGNLVLKKMAEHIREEAARYNYGERVFTFRKENTEKKQNNNDDESAYRIGGDEFVVLVPGDISPYLLKKIVDGYGEREHQGVKTSLRGVIGKTYAEAVEAMVVQKEQEKSIFSKLIGKIANIRS